MPSGVQYAVGCSIKSINSWRIRNASLEYWINVESLSPLPRRKSLTSFTKQTNPTH